MSLTALDPILRRAALKLLTAALLTALAAWAALSASRQAQAQTPAPAAPKTYTDTQYQFAFQYPGDWKPQKLPARSGAGEVRAVFKHPSKAAYVIASVGDLGYALTRKQYLEHKDRAKVDDSLLDWIATRLYRTTSMELGAERMELVQKDVSHDDVGIVLYLATGSKVGDGTVAIAGQHVMPFGSSHIVNFMLISPADPGAEQDNEILHHVFNSFHMLAQAK